MLINYNNDIIKKKKLISIHQPDFLPHINFFIKAKKSMQLVILDDVQFLRRGWTHRDQILTKNGVEWITIPVRKTSRDAKIYNIEILKDNKIYLDILKKIKQAYSKSPFFEETFEILNKIFDFPSTNLCKFNLNSIYILFDKLSINTEIILQSNLNIKEKNNDLLIGILKKLKSSHYLSGLGAKSYISESKFKKNKIKIYWNNFEIIKYKQFNNSYAFVTDLSIIDMLFNCGIKKTKIIINKIIK